MTLADLTPEQESRVMELIEALTARGYTDVNLEIKPYGTGPAAAQILQVNGREQTNGVGWHCACYFANAEGFAVALDSLAVGIAGVRRGDCP